MIQTLYIDHMGSDLSVVNAARVSFAKKSEWNPDWRDDHYEPLLPADSKLIKYLAKHKHMSPFGHAFASFHVKAPVFVARQLVKHKFLRWNEISRRYVDHEPEFYQPTEWRGRSVDAKQGSTGVVEVANKPIIGQAVWRSLECYRELLRQGICPEQARMVLPQSMVTEWYWSGSLDAFADMCNLRCKPDTQYETQVVAGHIDTEMLKLFPVSWKALRGDAE
jgi:thymidylate synthase (FAD)